MGNFIVAQIFGALGIVANICSMQFKQRKHILIALLLLSLFSALNFIFLGTLSGAYISFFAIVEILVNSAFETKKRSVPKLVVAFYILVNIILGMLNFTGPLDFLPIACAIIFCISILLKNEQNIRKLMLSNQFLWIIFDLSVGAYTFAISDVLTITSTLIALYRFRNRKTHVKKKG